MAYADYQQPALKRPVPQPQDQGFDPTGQNPQPDPSQPPAAAPVDQSTALQQVQQAYMQPNPQPTLGFNDPNGNTGAFGGITRGAPIGPNPLQPAPNPVPQGGLSAVTGGNLGINPMPSGGYLQFQDQRNMPGGPMDVGRGLEIAQPGGAPAAGGYTPGQGAGMYLGDFLSRQAATPSLTDPTLQPIVAAGRLADQRSADRQRAALAEQLGGAGLGSSGAMNVGQGKIQQQQGETQALRESGLLQQEQQSRNANLLAGLGQDASRYQFDQGAGIDLARLEALLNGQAMQPFLGGY